MILKADGAGPVALYLGLMHQTQTLVVMAIMITIYGIEKLLETRSITALA